MDMSCSVCRKDYNTIYKFQEDNSLRFKARINNIMTNSKRETICVMFAVDKVNKVHKPLSLINIFDQLCVKFS